MKDEGKYDPDRMSFNDLDRRDIAAVDAWLADPVAEALAEDRGRRFRSRPAGEQRTELMAELPKAEARRETLTGLRRRETDPEFRSAMEAALLSVDDYLIAIQTRLAELENP